MSAFDMAIEDLFADPNIAKTATYRAGVSIRLATRVVSFWR